MSLVVRPERSGDEAAIFAVTRDAFATVAYASGTEQQIVGALREAGALTASYVAVADDVVVGHVAISPVTISQDGGTPDGEASPSVDGWCGLGPVSVRPDHQGKGLGTLLIRQALDAIRSEQGCVLLGSLHYYGRFGFRVDPRLVPADGPAEYFQVLPLAAVEIPHGTVRFHRAFDVEPQR